MYKILGSNNTEWHPRAHPAMESYNAIAVIIYNAIAGISYNAIAVIIYTATSSLVRSENKNIFSSAYEKMLQPITHHTGVAVENSEVVG
jgi:type III secretory pathway lipoprotein EscJ